jgi:CBS domain-containing protein
MRKEVLSMKVSDLISPGVVTIAPEESAALAARLLSRHNVGALPVCGRDGRLRGMVTDRDIVLRCVAPEEDPAQTPVRDIMTRCCTAVSAEDDPVHAARLMALGQVRRLPVTREGRVVGVLSLSDLARAGQFQMEAAQALSEISLGVCPPRRE